MAKFTYCNFSDGRWDTDFVAHAKRFTKEQALELCVLSSDWKFKEKYCEGRLHRKPSLEDIKEATARWYPKAPERCGSDHEGGCYTFCEPGERGSFPVWVIRFEDLLIKGDK